MNDETDRTRSHSHEIEIDVPIERVWKAISDAEEITRWFSEEAKVTPGEGGHFWVSWGQGQSGASRIEIWEPERRLRLANLPAENEFGPEAARPTLKIPIVEEYTLTSRGNRTVLRLVHSNIPDSPDWDGFYDGTNRGWDMFFLGLRHYLTKHWGKPRKTIMAMQPVPFGFQEAWDTLIGEGGFDALSNLQPGERYSFTTSAGDALTGEVVMALPPKTLCATVENIDESFLSVAFEEMGGKTFFYLTLATFGMDPEKFEELQERWTAWLKRIYPFDPVSIDAKPIR